MDAGDPVVDAVRVEEVRCPLDDPVAEWR